MEDHIYEAVDAPYFRVVKLFIKNDIYHYKNHTNDPQKIQLISRRIFKNCIGGYFICAGDEDFS